jgi:hypothetical protein
MPGPEDVMMEEEMPTEDPSAMNAQAGQEAVADVGGGAPVAESPLSAERLDAMGEALNAAKETLAGGQIPPIEYQPYMEDADQMAPEMYADLKSFSDFLAAASQAGIASAGQYDIDVEAAASSNEGLAQAVAEVRKASQDQALMQEIQSSAPPDAAGAPPEDMGTPPEIANPEEDAEMLR